MHEDSLRSSIKKTEWRQGVVVEGTQKDEVLSHVAESYGWIRDADTLVLFTHDCDLLNHTIDNEPFAEFFCTKNIAQVDPSLAYGKNPRKIHLKLHDSKCLCLSINHRIRIDRTLLATLPLEKNPLRLPEPELTNLLHWISKKYSRPAFPDRFNDLLSGISKLDKKLTNLNNSFTRIKSIFFLINPNTEIEDDQSYSLKIMVLLAGTAFDGCEDEKDLIKDKLEPILTTDKICISTITCAFENEMTLFELNYYKEWDKDYISRRYGYVR